MPLSVVKWACFHIDRAKIETPARIESRPSNLPVVRPIVAIVNALASAPGRITNPVCSAVKFWRFWRYTGSTNTVAYRSEERRVGKECRARCGQADDENNTRRRRVKNGGR